MALSLIVTAILVLSPAKVADVAITYAGSIERQSRAQSLDPLLTASLIHVETGGQWSATMVSKSNDYGLMQPHVSRTTNSEYLGYEELLFIPEINIAVGTKMLAYWKQYHKRCKTRHHWWSHYKWGINVKNDLYGQKVASVYARVKRIKLVATEEHDYSNRRIGCFWESDTGGSGSTGVTALNRYLIPEVRWTVWDRHNESFKGECGLLRPGYDGSLVAITRRRRSVPGAYDYGQVRCSI